jgi:hypothetical protein
MELRQRDQATQVRELRLNGVWCRSAASADGRSRELAWFPGTRAARPLRKAPLTFGSWRYASNWRDIGLREQPDPASPRAVS